MQKGLWERLLCQECEGRFGRYESYAAALLTRAGRQVDSEANGYLSVCGEDYAICLFHVQAIRLIGSVAHGRVKPSLLFRRSFGVAPRAPTDHGLGR